MSPGAATTTGGFPNARLVPRSNVTIGRHFDAPNITLSTFRPFSTSILSLHEPPRAKMLEDGGGLRWDAVWRSRILAVYFSGILRGGKIYVSFRTRARFLRRSISRDSSNRTSQARVGNTRVSGPTLCPLGQSKKAIGHVSPIGPCVATHSVDNRQACWFQKTNGAALTRSGNHSKEEAYLHLANGDETGPLA